MTSAVAGRLDSAVQNRFDRFDLMSVGFVRCEVASAAVLTGFQLGDLGLEAVDSLLLVLCSARCVQESGVRLRLRRRRRWASVTE
jgi:hypothetical protein